MTADLRLELRKTLQEGHADVARDVDQMQSLFADVASDLGRLLGALNQEPAAATPDRDPAHACGPAGAPRNAGASERAVLMRRLMMLLQFEDIATQILQRARSRLVLLEEFAIDALLGTLAQPSSPPGDGPEGDTQRALRELIAHHRDRTRDMLQRGLRQQSLDPGDIVLF